MDIQAIKKAEKAIEEFSNSVAALKRSIQSKSYNSDNAEKQFIKRTNRLHRRLRVAADSEQAKDAVRRDEAMNDLALSIYKISGFSEKEMQKYNGRKREYVEPKQVHMALLHKIFGLSQKIAGDLYHRHRCTVIHSCKEVVGLYLNRLYKRTYKDAFDVCRKFDFELTEAYLNGDEKHRKIRL
jgi:chromosomal replication initiation ATPase DnaA